MYKYTIVASLKIFFKYNFHYIKCQIICLLLGFLVATILSTLPAQTGDWGVVAGSVIITINEIISKLVYSSRKNIFTGLKIMNYIKIGIIYGLFVDAFKLGS
uniref:hypothetical protein n=1 Tax=Caulacanthus ustulatus TaxID=31411 RepID=UPI0027DA5455|nr:hypothetical protein REQ00_pgp137 [Caulacanthus ustulatus]WCH57288.1 hypothetical protein [Caulacanthus ustulatus]